MSLLVIGCASVDTIHIENVGHRETYHTVGGAGLYTALAAASVDASNSVTLLAPRPEKLPASLAFVEGKLLWPGPSMLIESHLPRLEIVHHGAGRATLLGADWGEEKLLRADNQDLIDMIVTAQPDIVHIAALSGAAHQVDIARALNRLRNDSAEKSSNELKNLKISGGTYARAIGADKGSVLELLNLCDYFFMNSNEAGMLGFSGTVSAPGSVQTSPTSRLVFVTDGASGASICGAAEGAIHIDAFPAVELDPTGAGDTFCGATLAGIDTGLSARVAASNAAKLAASIISYPGCNFYLQK